MATIPSPEQPAAGNRLGQLVQFVRDLSIGNKLGVGFGSLVAWIVFLVLLSYLASAAAKSSFQRTKDLRLPTTLNSAFSELEMYEMIGYIQSYLALGEPRFREQYNHGKEEIAELLDEMEQMSVNWTNEENLLRLENLQIKLDEWFPLVDQMFALRDNQIANEPAVEMLLQTARPAASDIVAYTKLLIDEQVVREPTTSNMQLLKTLSDLQSSFGLMSSAVDAYLAGRLPASKDLYYSALTRNEESWQILDYTQVQLSPEQKDTFVWLAQARNVFLSLPEEMFTAVESERAREDYYILRTQAMPLAEEIAAILGELREDQVALLAIDVNSVNDRLSAAQIWTVAGAVISALLAMVLGYAISRDIADPIRRLTTATYLITRGDMETRVPVQSKDEIGALSSSLNEMTERLQRTLADVEQRARVIDTSSRISRQLSTILNQEELVHEVVKQVRSAFDYYYAHIFLLDESGEHLVAAGGADASDRSVVEPGYSIPISQGLVGQAYRQKSPVLISDVSKNADFLPNPKLPHTRSEIAVPIASGDRILGVLDVQHKAIDGITQVDVDLLQSIASQVAIALQNARSYSATQRRASRERLINEINQKILATSSVDQAIQVAVRELGRAVDAPLTTIRLNNGDSTSS